jgi:tRNA threonylcarbamoyladenosine biosynthesis protein TsaB
MLVLAIDTSTQDAIVAAAPSDDHARLIFRAERVTTHSERLLTLVDEVFAELHAAPRELGLVACAAGPGSFTGLRIGLATAKGLCLGTGAKLALLPSLAVRAACAPAGARVVAAIDAFRGEAYAACFTFDDQRLPTEDGQTASALPEALHARAAAWSPTHAIGDGFSRYPSAKPAGASLLPLEPGALAESMIRLARARLASARFDDPRTAAPLYVRAAAPEEARG